MRLLICGVNHRTAPVEVRERLAFDQQSLPAALRGLKSRAGIEEALVLSTCNRVELVVAAGEEVGPESVLAYLKDARELPALEIGSGAYVYEGRDAIHHLFRVAASLDSMIVGEPQILGQLKAAYATAKAEDALGPHLDMLLTRAFSVAKRVRSETGIGHSAVSVSYAAVELAREIFGGLAGRKVMIVGAGKMSELAARHLNRSGASHIYVTNRTYERGLEMARMFEGTLVEYDRFTSVLPEIDILIASSGAPHYILRKDQVRRVIDARRNRPMFLIDIAVPRNIDPAVNELDNVYLYDIDDLQKVVDANRQERMKRAEAAEEIIAREVDRMLERLHARQVAPTIVSLQDQLEQVRVAEIERVRGRLGELTPQQEEALEALTRGIINKIAHAPISELRRQAGRPEGSHIIDVIRRLFHVKD